MFLILNLRYSVKRNNLQILCGVVVYHMAVVTKTEEPGFLVDELNPIQVMGLLRSPSLSDFSKKVLGNTLKLS